MRIFAKVKPNSREEKVDKISASEFLLKVNAPPKEGKANARVLELLSEYFDVAKNRIRIIRGEKSKNKIVEILDKY